MEGDSPNTSTQSSPNPVPQIPAEYDDLYLQQGSYTTQRDFSHDINKRMKMPNRLSVDGKTLHDLEVENMRANSSSSQLTASAGMAVPDKITLAGPSQRDILEEPYGFMNTISQENSSYVNITTPPRVLTVEERFPVVQDESLDTTGQEMGSQMRGLEHGLSPAKQLDDSIQEYAPSNTNSLESRLLNLERLEQQRQTRELVIYPAVILYVSYRLLSWFFSRS